MDARRVQIPSFQSFLSPCRPDGSRSYFQEKPESLFCPERYPLDRLAVFEQLYAAKSGMLGGHLVVAGPVSGKVTLCLCLQRARPG
jgi:hypothetical protein